MTTSKSYQIKPSANFETSYQKLIRSHYRKAPQALERFNSFVSELLRGLTLKPRLGPPYSYREPWPKGSNREGWELWKFYFDMPGFTGASGQARLMYLIHEESLTVHPLWVYTHAEFEGRPADKDLQKVLKRLMSQQT